MRVDVRVLDDDGALLDCASLAAVAALYHFRRPNVTVEPNRTIIVSFQCVFLAFFFSSFVPAMCSVSPVFLAIFSILNMNKPLYRSTSITCQYAFHLDSQRPGRKDTCFVSAFLA